MPCKQEINELVEKFNTNFRDEAQIRDQAILLQFQKR